MKIVKQPIGLPIVNHDVEKYERIKHNKLFPSTIRSTIVGPSNCGKTNVMISLIEHENGLKFENVYIYSRSLGQAKYKYLEQLLKPIKGIGYYTFNAGDNIMHPTEAKPNSIFIFDDVSCDNQDVIREYFSMGRHNNIDSFYLSQTYAKIPKHLIRDNTNVLVLFKQDDLNLRHVYNDHVGSDFSFEKFKQICSHCWKQPHEFVSIFKDNKLNDGRYRKGFDHYIYV